MLFRSKTIISPQCLRQLIVLTGGTDFVTDVRTFGWDINNRDSFANVILSDSSCDNVDTAAIMGSRHADDGMIFVLLFMTTFGCKYMDAKCTEDKRGWFCRAFANTDISLEL